MLSQNSKRVTHNDSSQAIKLKTLVGCKLMQSVDLKSVNQQQKISNFKYKGDSRDHHTSKQLVKRKNKSNDFEKRRHFFQDSFPQNNFRKASDAQTVLPSFLNNKHTTLYKNQSANFPTYHHILSHHQERKTPENAENSQWQTEIGFKKKMSLGQSIYKQLKTTTSTNVSTPSLNENVQRIKAINPNEQAASKTNSFWNQKKVKRQLRISDFQLIKYIEEGQFGEVHLARHIATNFLCALKKISKSMFGADPSYLIREIKIQSYLQHPNIVRLYNFFSDDHYIYLMMQYCSGGNLFSHLKKQIRLPEYKVKKYLNQVCRAVEFMHKHDIIHRDIKPQNILVHHDMLKICDFGWSVRCPTLRSTHCGTPLYSSPEVVLKKQYDSKIDVWNIGVLTYELLYGKAPFQIRGEQDLIKVVYEDIFFSKHYPVSNAAKDFILRCLKKNPKQRDCMKRLLDHQFFQQ